MKQASILFAIIVLLSACQKEKNTPETFNKDQIASLEKKANSIYLTNPMEAIRNLDRVISFYKQDKNLKRLATAQLNVSNIYEEQLKNYPNALKYASASLETYTQLNDSIRMANLFKYTGYLKGLQGEFEKANADINKAIEIFNTFGHSNGVATSILNLAKVEFLRGDLAQAESNYETSLAHWKERNIPFRIFTTQNFGIQLYRKLGKDYSSLIESNQALIENNQIPQAAINEFKRINK